MIYVVADDDPQDRGLWVEYVKHCVQWRMSMLERTAWRRPGSSSQDERIATLKSEIHGGYRRPELRTTHYWTDARLLWEQQPATAQDVVIASVSAKFSAMPEVLGLVDTPRRFVFLPKSARVLGNAVGDVARDTQVIWQFRNRFVGQRSAATEEANRWLLAARTLAALLNRGEHFPDGSYHGHLGGRDGAWAAYRLSAEPDLPDIELVPSWMHVRGGSASSAS